MTVPSNPLHSLHQQAEAEFQEYGELEIVSTFGEPQAEYAAIRKGCGVMDLPQRSVIELTGADRLTFLNNLLTNQTFDKGEKKGMAVGSGVYAFLLHSSGPKAGRIIADMNVLELGDRTLLELDGRVAETVRAALEKYLFAEKVKIQSRAGELHQIALHGPAAAEIAGGAELNVLAAEQREMFGERVIVYRDDPCGVPGYFVIASSEAAPRVWMELLSRFGAADVLGKRRVRPIGWAAFNAARIEAGRPIFGVDFDDSVLPAETGTATLARAVSFTKGCYPGQEIVARMHARQQVAKQLVGVRMEDDGLPIAGTPVMDEAGNQIGGVMSSTVSPLLSNVAICLAYVRKPWFAVGSKLVIPAEGKKRSGTVVELPFVSSERG